MRTAIVSAIDRRSAIDRQAVASWGSGHERPIRRLAGDRGYRGVETRFGSCRRGARRPALDRRQRVTASAGSTAAVGDLEAFPRAPFRSPDRAIVFPPRSETLARDEHRASQTEARATKRTPPDARMHAREHIAQMPETLEKDMGVPRRRRQAPRAAVSLAASILARSWPSGRKRAAQGCKATTDSSDEAPCSTRGAPRS